MDPFALDFLVGTWEGEGTGTYSTIETFRYQESLVFEHDGRPFLFERQRTVNLDTGKPSHAESGFWRVVAPGTVEAVLAHHTGIVEVSEGTVSPVAQRIELRARDITMSPTAKLVTTMSRVLEVDGDELHTTLDMGAVGEPHQRHLESRLHRTRSS